MPAYGTQDPAFAGLKIGFDNNTETLLAAEAIAFGVPLFGYVGDAVKAYNYALDVNKLVFSADLITSNKVNGSVNGVAYAEVTFASTHAATMTALINAMKAISGVEAVLDSTDTNGRTILVRTKGADCTVTATVTAGSTQATATITTGNGQVFVGIAQHTQKTPGSYEIQDAVNVLAVGQVWAKASAATANGIAYVTTAGIFGSSGIDVGCVFRSALSTDIAIVEVRDRNALTYAARF